MNLDWKGIGIVWAITMAVVITVAVLESLPGGNPNRIDSARLLIWIPWTLTMLRLAAKR